MYLHYFVIIYSWKRAGPFIWRNLNPFTQGCFVQSLVEIGPCSGSGEENVKSLRTDDRRLEKLTWPFSSGELKTCCCEPVNKPFRHHKKNKKCCICKISLCCSLRWFSAIRFRPSPYVNILTILFSLLKLLHKLGLRVWLKTVKISDFFKNHCSKEESFYINCEIHGPMEKG